jgi:hypothetical protein
VTIIFAIRAVVVVGLITVCLVDSSLSEPELMMQEKEVSESLSVEEAGLPEGVLGIFSNLRVEIGISLWLGFRYGCRLEAGEVRMSIRADTGGEMIGRSRAAMG